VVEVTQLGRAAGRQRRVPWPARSSLDGHL